MFPLFIDPIDLELIVRDHHLNNDLALHLHAARLWVNLDAIFRIVPLKELFAETPEETDADALFDRSVPVNPELVFHIFPNVFLVAFRL